MTSPQPERRRALVATVLLLVAAAAALGGAAALGWARVGFQVPLRGGVAVWVTGADLVPALAPLALLALAAVAAVLATGGWVRRLLGALLLLTALPAGFGLAPLADQGKLVGSAVSVAELPARSVPDGTVTVALVGPTLAAVAAVLLIAAGAVLLLRGHRMPRMGRRYRVPSARGSEAVPGPQGLWDRIDAGEDPTALDDPR